MNAERSKTAPNQIKAAKLPSITDPQGSLRILNWGSSIEDPQLRILEDPQLSSIEDPQLRILKDP